VTGNEEVVVPVAAVFVAGVVDAPGLLDACVAGLAGVVLSGDCAGFVTVVEMFVAADVLDGVELSSARRGMPTRRRHKPSPRQN
jgi:hypothetical protein